MSGGKFEVSVHAAGELMPAFGVVDGVQQGSIEIGHTCAYYYFGKDPTFTFATSLPFGMNKRMMDAWMFSGGGMELMNEFFKSYNFISMPGGNTGTQMGGWFRRYIFGGDVRWAVFLCASLATD